MNNLITQFRKLLQISKVLLSTMSTLGLIVHAETLPYTETHTGEPAFSLLPRSFQKNPKIYMTVITEMTSVGKQYKLPTSDSPTYYFAVTAGYHDEGQGVAGEKPLPVNELESKLKTSLAVSHYLPANKEHKATMALIFVWGSHNTLDQDTASQADAINAGDFSQTSAPNEAQAKQNLLSRAALVGGAHFAHDFEIALNQESLAKATNIHGLGVSPLEKFMDRDDKTRELVEQAYDDCYYVVVSAYDGAALAKGKRILLWRTKMTTNSRGLSMSMSLPVLIETGAHFFGKPDMEDAATLERNAVAEGQVKIGTPVRVKDKP